MEVIEITDEDYLNTHVGRQNELYEEEFEVEIVWGVK
jgi:hypothetical protein